MLNHITVMGRLVRDPERRSAEILAGSVNFGDSKPQAPAALAAKTRPEPCRNPLQNFSS